MLITVRLVLISLKYLLLRLMKLRRELLTWWAKVNLLVGRLKDLSLVKSATFWWSRNQLIPRHVEKGREKEIYYGLNLHYKFISSDIFKYYIYKWFNFTFDRSAWSWFPSVSNEITVFQGQVQTVQFNLIIFKISVIYKILDNLYFFHSFIHSFLLPFILNLTQ